MHFSKFIFYVFFSTLGISKQLWASSSYLILLPPVSFLHSHHLSLRCTSYSIPASPCSSFLCEGLLLQQNIHYFGEKNENTTSLVIFLKITQSCWWAVCDAENLTVHVCICMSYMWMCVVYEWLNMCQSIWVCKTNSQEHRVPKWLCCRNILKEWELCVGLYLTL